MVLSGKMEKIRQSREDKPLKTLIEDAGLTQKQLAKEIGVAYSAMQYWVAGERMPSLENACRLSLALRCPLPTLAEAFGLEFYREDGD